MRLVDLHPYFIGSGGAGVYAKTGRACGACRSEDRASCDACFGTGDEYGPAPERDGVGIVCDCPCGNTDEHHQLYVPFKNPLDGGPALDDRTGWQRTGDTFETLTLTPSILRRSHCGWHGYITNGNVTSV